MPDKKRDRKRDRKTDMLRKEQSTMRQPQTFSDNLNMQMEQTIAAVVQAETYPQGMPKSETEQEDEEEPDYPRALGEKRYTQSAYTVAQNYIDRVEFRH